jgi:AcrR family transcriptional regulator
MRCGGEGNPVIDRVELPREKILAEATQMVTEDGADAVTIRSLARRLGLAPATIYSHFRSKNELLGQIALHGFEQLLCTTREATELADVRQAMAEGGRRYLDFALAHPTLYKLMFDEFDIGPYRDDPAVLVPGRALFDVYRDLYARGVAAGCIRAVDPDVQTLLSWSAIHGFAMLVLSGRLPPPRMPMADLTAIREGFLGFLEDALRP